jgi:hypothetical protein
MALSASGSSSVQALFLAFAFGFGPDALLAGVEWLSFPFGQQLLFHLRLRRFICKV